MRAFRFTEFGGPKPQRPVQDLAFAVARFIQTGGTFVNYYMVSFFYKESILRPKVFRITSETYISIYILSNSTMVERTSDELQEVHSSLLVTTMMLLLMNMVRI